jgi:hypothetical protein
MWISFGSIFAMYILSLSESYAIAEGTALTGIVAIITFGD